MSGWKLTTALIGKHFNVLGDTIAQAIASYDPETATEVDRDNLRAKLREIAQKKAQAQIKYDAAQKAATDLATLIETDTKAAPVLIAKFDKGDVDEATLTEFTNNLEAQKAALPGKQQDAADAKQLLDTLQEIFTTVEQNLNEFDSRAKQAQRDIEQARAEKDRQDLRIANQAELSRLQAGAGGSSTALNALNKQAEKLRVEAAATKDLADVGQKPIDRAHAVDEARRIANGTAPAANESPAERLRRLTGQ